MFICDNCYEKKKIDGYKLVTSRGQCESCKEVSVCWDIPSRYLDLSKEEKDERRATIAELGKIKDFYDSVTENFENTLGVIYKNKDGR